MFNPPDHHQNSSSYMGLLKRITQGVQQKKVGDQILETVRQAFEKQLDDEKVVLSRPEKVRLLRQVTIAVLTEVRAKVDDTN